MKKMLMDIINSFRVSGSETGAIEVIKEQLKDVDCKIEEDCLKNLIVKIGSGKEKIMFTANMDEVGLMVTYIEDNGFLRVDNIGEIECSETVGAFVEFANGTRGRVIATKEKPSFSDLFIDIMVENKEEANKLVKEGDICKFNYPSLNKKGRIQASGLNNALGCVALLKAIKELKNSSKECYFVFSSQGELEGRGGRAAAFSIKPDKCVVVSTHGAGDFIGGEGKIELGKGPVLRIKDKNLIASQELREEIEKAAEKDNVSLQLNVGTETSEGGPIHKEVGGIKTAVLAVPLRYKKSLVSMASASDVEEVATIIKALC